MMSSISSDEKQLAIRGFISVTSSFSAASKSFLSSSVTFLDLPLALPLLLVLLTMVFSNGCSSLQFPSSQLHSLAQSSNCAMAQKGRSLNPMSGIMLLLNKLLNQ